MTAPQEKPTRFSRDEGTKRINTVRESLRTWATKQPDSIRSAAGLIVKNLKHLAKEPDDEMLLAQTKINIARLEGLRRAAADGR